MYRRKQEEEKAKLELEHQERRRQREEKRRLKAMEKRQREEQEYLDTKIKLEEKKIMVTQRRLQSIRMLGELFKRVQVSFPIFLFKLFQMNKQIK